MAAAVNTVDVRDASAGPNGLVKVCGTWRGRGEPNTCSGTSTGTRTEPGPPSPPRATPARRGTNQRPASEIEAGRMAW